MSVIVFREDAVEGAQRFVMLAPIMVWGLANTGQEWLFDNRRQAVVFAAVAGLSFSISMSDPPLPTPGVVVRAIPLAATYGALQAYVMSSMHLHIHRWRTRSARPT